MTEKFVTQDKNEMTDESYEIWLRDFKMTVDTRLANGAKFLPFIPKRVWKYWHNKAKLEAGNEDTSS